MRRTFGTSIGCKCGYHFVEIRTLKKEERRWIMDIKCPVCEREAKLRLDITVLEIKEPSGK